VGRVFGDLIAIREIFMHRARRLSTLLLLLNLAAAGAASAGGTYTVDRFDDDLNADDCLDGTANDCSLRGAIRAGNQDGVDSVVVVPDGLYQLTREGGGEEFATTGDLDIVFDGLTIEAAPGAHPVIQQLTTDRIFDVDPSAGDVVFQGPMTLLGGDAFNSSGDERGGSIYFFRADSLTLTDVHFDGGFATDSGGCLYWAAPISPGSLSMTDVTFTNCETEDTGGGFFIESDDSIVTFDRVSATDNTAGDNGGGGTILGGTTTVVVDRSSFERNTAAASFLVSALGGGLVLSNGSFLVRESTFADNVAGRSGGSSASGGGAFVQNSAVLFYNSTFSDNRALAPVGDGADLAAQSSTLGFAFVTVQGDAGSFPESIDVSIGSTLDLFATVIDRADCAGSGNIDSSGFNVERPYGGGAASQCGLDHVSDVVTTSPLLRPLSGYGGPTRTHALLPAAESTAFIVSSPDCADTDQRGAPRLSLFCYSGAYEANAEPPGASIFTDGFESGDVAAWSLSVP